MKLLCDENLSPALSKRLQDVFPDSLHISDVGLGGAPDAHIWAYAKQYELVIVTKDRDFAARSSRDRDAPKVIWLRVGNGSTTRIEDLIRVHHSSVLMFLQSKETCLELEDRPFIVKH